MSAQLMYVLPQLKNEDAFDATLQTCALQGSAKDKL